MANGIVPLTELIAQFERLPGIGKKTAQRLAFNILEQPPEYAENLLRHCLTHAKKYIFARSASLYGRRDMQYMLR